MLELNPLHTMNWYCKREDPTIWAFDHKVETGMMIAETRINCAVF